MGMDKITSTLIADHLSILASFSTAFGAHIGIGTLPLVWYGTEEQKQRYLPKLATAEWIGAYALSEATSGSDAMNVRTRATLSADGTHLYAQRRKDVDHQLRHRRPVHGFRQDRWREVFRLPHRARSLPASPSALKSTSSASADHPPARWSCRTARSRLRTCSANPARATTSPSTCSTWAASSWAWPASAERVTPSHTWFAMPRSAKPSASRSPSSA